MRSTLVTLALLALCGIVFLLHPACSLFSSADTLETPEWFLNGLPAPSSASIKVLTDSIIPKVTEREWTYSPHAEGMTWRVDTVGRLGNRTVIDLFCTIKFRDYSDTSKYLDVNAIKASAIATSSDNYRLIYARGTVPYDVHFGPSHLIDVGGSEVLYTKSRLGGQSEDYDEACWTWDTEREVPHDLGLWKQILAAEYRLLPRSHKYVNGQFDFDSMSIQGWAVRDGDDYRHPTGGYARIQFGVEAGKLKVKRATIDFNNVGPPPV